jgi:serine/threonine-protein kinase SRPK3
LPLLPCFLFLTGGYHPVKIGEVYNDRYTIERKLGWGHFSTVWLASDAHVPDDHPHKLVAVKVQKSAQHYTEAALDEIDLLNQLRREGAKGEAPGAAYVVHLLDHFIAHGPHGKHVCLVFETMGQNLLALIKRYNYHGIPAFIVKIMARQLLEGLHFMHSNCKIIHTDLKPENFMMLSQPLDLEEVQYLRRRAVAAEATARAASQRAAENPLAGLRPAFQGIATNVPGQGGVLSKAQKKRLKAKAKKAAAKAAAAGGDADADADADSDADSDVEGEGEGADAAAAPVPAGDDDSKATDNATSSSSRSSSAADAVSAAAADPFDEANAPWVARRRAREAAFALKSPLARAIERYSIKIADLGNGCWTDKHFTSDVTTRQYRAPEVIVGSDYCTEIDIWSVACIVFELLTGDYLFDPKADPGRHSRNEDHLALIIELLGPLPKKLMTEGTQSRAYFNKRGELTNIKTLETWPLRGVLTEKYHLHPRDAAQLCAFLLPMLTTNPATRVKAAKALDADWLNLNAIDIFELRHADGSVESLSPQLRAEILREEKERVAEATADARAAGVQIEDRVLRAFEPYHGWLRRRDRDPDAELAQAEAEALAEAEGAEALTEADETEASADADAGAAGNITSNAPGKQAESAADVPETEAATAETGTEADADSEAGVDGKEDPEAADADADAPDANADSRGSGSADADAGVKASEAEAEPGAAEARAAADADAEGDADGDGDDDKGAQDQPQQVSQQKPQQQQQHQQQQKKQKNKKNKK